MPCIGENLTASLNARISSMPREEAASISIKSISEHPASFAKILAKLVLPVPREPEKDRRGKSAPALTAFLKPKRYAPAPELPQSSAADICDKGLS